LDERIERSDERIERSDERTENSDEKMERSDENDRKLKERKAQKHLQRISRPLTHLTTVPIISTVNISI